MWTWERRENISIHISGSSRVPETSPWSSLIIIARQQKQAADTLRGCNSAAVWGKVVLSCCQFLPHPPFLFSHSGHFLMHFSSHFLAPFSFRLTPSQSKWRLNTKSRHQVCKWKVSLLTEPWVCMNKESGVSTFPNISSCGEGAECREAHLGLALPCFSSLVGKLFFIQLCSFGILFSTSLRTDTLWHVWN